MKANQQMRELLRHVVYPAKLPPDLMELACAGFERIDGCFVLSGQKSFARHVSVKQLGDRTAFENFVNAVRLDDYVDELRLGSAIYFVREVFAKWKCMSVRGVLYAAMYANELRVDVRFVVLRNDEPKLLADDLDAYLDSGVLEIDSGDNWPFA